MGVAGKCRDEYGAESEQMKSELHMLVVDGDATFRARLEKMLVRDGYNVRLAEDGDQALSLLRQEPVDVVLVSTMVPPLTGLELLRILKREAPHIGIILIAASRDLHTVKDALRLGADEYLTRPFKSHELTLVVKRVYWKIISEKRRQSTVGKPG